MKLASTANCYLKSLSFNSLFVLSDQLNPHFDSGLTDDINISNPPNSETHNWLVKSIGLGIGLPQAQGGRAQQTMRTQVVLSTNLNRSSRKFIFVLSATRSDLEWVPLLSLVHLRHLSFSSLSLTLFLFLFSRQRLSCKDDNTMASLVDAGYMRYLLSEWSILEICKSWNLQELLLVL